MTTLPRSGSALLVIDFQVGVVQEAYENSRVADAINVAIDKARAAGIAVVWVQHSDEELVLKSPAWAIDSRLHHDATEPHIRKLYPSSFESTDLEQVLAELNVGHVYLCGAESNNCVRHTGHAALERGYDVTLITDAHTTNGFEWNGYIVDAARVIDEQNTNFMGRQLPGRAANAVSSAELKF